MNETINERINQLIRWSGLSKNAFANKIGERGFNIQNITGHQQTTPSAPLMGKIAKAFEEVSLEWLILGKGKMLKLEDEEKNISEEEYDKLRILNAEYSGQITMLKVLLKEKEEEILKLNINMREKE